LRLAVHELEKAHAVAVELLEDDDVARLVEFNEVRVAQHDAQWL
jgi:hypothetical protein